MQGSANTYARSDHIHNLPSLTSLQGTLPINRGGTGATSSSNARSSLGAAAIPVSFTISLPSTSWGSQASSNGIYYWSQSVSISGGGSNSIIDLNPDAATLCGMVKSGTAAIYIGNSNGSFTAYAIDAKPIVNLNNIPAVRWEKV